MMPFLANRRSRAPATVAAALALLLPSAAFADYRLAIGDVVETSVIGIPELRQRSQVSQDGEILLPLGGQLRVDGLTMAEVRDKARQLLPTKEFRRRNEDGREYPVIIAPSDVQIAVAEYRPVYLNGDVAKPGEQPFRPGLTVRQAIALSGGYDVMRFRMNNPFLEQADLKSEYESLWSQFAKEQARLARLRAELDNRTEIDPKQLTETPLPNRLTDPIVAVERDKLATRNDDFGKERTYLAQAVVKEGDRMAVLSEQQQKERAGVEADTEDLQRVQDIYQKGNVPITRVVEARRSLLLSSTRQLQTTALLDQVDRERQEFSRKADRLDDQRRLGLLDELQDATVKLQGIRSRLTAASEKLVYVGMVRSQLVRGKGSAPELTLIRKDGSAAAKSTQVTEDTELQPGDVVEVSLKADMIPGLPAQ
jgi:polysaccharide export outer membrane protein